ncbi:MAG TPA: GxxExxY protein [Rhodanobacteraceae bacterium]|nr:GxxExxY protein [Rhodanobacteraceae bacterium]
MNERLSEQVIGCAVEVSRQLGHGFLEKVYEGALAVELEEASIPYARQKNIAVQYRGRTIGEYCCDFVIANRLLLELKALTAITRTHEAQLMNYLKATGLTVGLLLNFGTPTLGIRRLVHSYNAEQPI